MIKYWVEKYHQVGYKYDGKLRHTRGEEAKAVACAHREHIAGPPEVKTRLNSLQDQQLLLQRGRRQD